MLVYSYDMSTSSINYINTVYTVYTVYTGSDLFLNNVSLKKKYLSLDYTRLVS